ncbi:MAG: hypothetical protein LBC80_05435 [Treponema sp.]|jgi:hypothetical protein|nr:hypothetical protein [Treponema sp.]
MKYLIEKQIIDAVKKLLTGRVNELLSELDLQVPLIEFSDYQGRFIVVPVVNPVSCERSEKERIIRLDVYSLMVHFSFPDTADSELFCYLFSGAFNEALNEDPTLGGIADRAVLTEKKYLPPKTKKSGDSWEIVIGLRITVEDITT